MNLNHLRHLIALAEHQSFHKAAEALFLTQPALSRSIQALERELAVKLIDRDGKSNTLTAYGTLVVERARRIVFEAKEVHRGVSLLKECKLGTLSIGLGPTPASILLLPFLGHMVSRYPEVYVKIARGSVELLTQSLRNESVDIIAIDRRALIAAEDLTVEDLPPLRGGFLCRSGHPLAKEASIRLEDLRKFPISSTPLSDEIARILVEDFGPEAHPAHLVTLNSEDINSLLDLVETTDTIFFGIYACARARILAGKFQEIQLEQQVELFGHYALVTQARRSEPPSVKLFRDFVRTKFGE